jgi:hypothetical protein
MVTGQIQDFGDMEKDFGFCNHKIHKPSTKSVFNPNPLVFDYDVKFYKLDLEAYDTTNQFSGSATVAAVAINPMDTFAIELSHKLAIDSTLINGVHYPAVHTDDYIFIELPANLAAGTFFTFQLYYHTPPGYVSNYYSSTVNSAYGNFPVSQSFSEPYYAHEWMPCKQELQDKADSVFIFITTDSSLKVAGPGLLTEVGLPDGKKRFEWRTHIPTAYYLISFAISDYTDYRIFAKPDSLAGDSILIQNMVYDYPNCLASYKTAINETHSMIELLSNLYCLFPFYKEKYGHYMWNPVGFSGMEHITMSGMKYFNTYLVSHELGHSWFGDNVTCATWSDIWINEGFATYTQYLVLEYLYSKASADAQMTTYMNSVMSQPGGSVYVPESQLSNWNRIFSSRLSYRKGSALIHMIRFEMNNDSLFFRSLYEFQNLFKDSVATGIDFRNTCQVVSGIDFTDFFNQWYFGEGFPLYSVNWSQQNDTLWLNAVQAASTIITPLFKMPMEYRISGDGTDTIIRVYQSVNDTTYKIIIPFEITEIVVDPNNNVLNQVNGINHIKNLDLTVFLEGPFDTVTLQMKTDLYTDILPESQPFNNPPWNYMGDEQVSNFLPNTVDWLLVELHDTSGVNSVSPSSVILKMAVLLMNDGRIVGADNFSKVQFAETISQQLFVIVRHRNHLGILSSSPLLYSKGVYHYDFTTGYDKVYGGLMGYKELYTGIWGMISGDANADGIINESGDKTIWTFESGENSYLDSDMNLNGQADNIDKNDLWLRNLEKESQVPE